MKKIIVLSVIILLSVCAQLQAKSYYIRVSTNTSDWSNITPDNTNSFIVDYTSGNDIAATLNAYLASDSIWMAKGTYTISATVAPKSGMIIRGGFAGTESTIQARSKSDLDGNGLVEPWEFTNTTEIVPASGLGIGYYGLNFSATNATVDGLTLKYFNITSGSPNVVKLFAGATGSIFKNSIVKDNTVSINTSATNGAICALIGTIQNCLIQNNSVTITGGGYSSFGAGIQLNNTGTVAIGCVIRGNKLSNTDNTKCKGAGAFIQTGSKLINCAVYNNETQGQGGGVYSNTNTCEILNCTIAKNKSGLTGGGLLIASIANFNNTIVWGNMAAGLANDIQTATGTANSNYLAYGIISGTFSASPLYTKVLTSGATADNLIDGTGTLAPKFLNPTTFVGVPSSVLSNDSANIMKKANFQLTALSPCLDYGSSTRLTANSISTDLMNGTRFLNINADLGAYEGTYYNTTITFNTNGTVGAYTSGTVISNLAGKSDLVYTITPNSGYHITSVLYNGTDVTSQLVSGVYNAPALTQNSTLNVTFDLGTAVSELNSKVQCFGNNNGIQINGLTPGDNVMIYGVAGNLISSQRATNNSLSIASAKGVYLVRIANQVSKLIVQ